jgi:CubicO group peptidase (beta-lactamase class C family)
MKNILVVWLLVVAVVAELEQDIKALIDDISDKSGYSFSVGYIDSQGRNFAIGSGPRKPSFFEDDLAPGNLTGNDTMQLGSGTKPTTAVSIMKLVDAKILSLDDLAN